MAVAGVLGTNDVKWRGGLRVLNTMSKPGHGLQDLGKHQAITYRNSLHGHVRTCT
jgi:hypothetical protein